LPSDLSPPTQLCGYKTRQTYRSHRLCDQMLQARVDSSHVASYRTANTMALNQTNLVHNDQVITKTRELQEAVDNHDHVLNATTEWFLCPNQDSNVCQVASPAAPTGSDVSDFI